MFYKKISDKQDVPLAGMSRSAPPPPRFAIVAAWGAAPTKDVGSKRSSKVKRAKRVSSASERLDRNGWIVVGSECGVVRILLSCSNSKNMNSCLFYLSSF
jgi:hypothetical protein